MDLLIAAKWCGSMLPAFSTTGCTVTSSLIFWIIQHVREKMKKLEDSPPQSPSLPCPFPAL
eukprot:9217933-Heterocapsa_arctica.AAC.1